MTTIIGIALVAGIVMLNINSNNEIEKLKAEGFEDYREFAA